MDDKNKGSGLGFLELLALVFITLKLCGVIDWQWKYVLMPIWMPLLIVAIILIIAWSK